MKVGIMTFPNSASFGAVLQMYALYRVIAELGADVEIVNYHSAFMKAELHTDIKKISVAQRRIKVWLKHQLHCRQRYLFKSFENRLNKYPRRPFCDRTQLQKLSDRYDKVVCGSDQVWNPDITDGDLSFFLDFCGNDTERIAYAPSFGIAEFSNSFCDSIQRELVKFSSLSAREIEGQQLVQQLTRQEVPLVLDPTFLLTETQWQELEQWHPAVKNDYILYYAVSDSCGMRDFCMKLAEKENKQVVIVGGNVLKQVCNKNNRITYAWDISPGQWLSLIRNAWCVVTNSFHGTAFSINYHKSVYVRIPEGTSSRLEQIIRTAGLEDRVIHPESVGDNTPIDYSRVEEKLVRARALSRSYLSNAIL